MTPAEIRALAKLTVTDDGEKMVEASKGGSYPVDCWHIEAGAPAPADAKANYVILNKAAYEQMRAELENATLGRGRLRLWLEFIHLNCYGDAKEFAGEALIGNHVPEGFEE